jgi:hypothetical protein
MAVLLEGLRESVEVLHGRSKSILEHMPPQTEDALGSQMVVCRGRTAPQVRGRRF